MKKGLIICIILLSLLTYCNIVMYGEINREWQKAKAEYAAVNQKYEQTMEELRCQLQLIDLYKYIRTVNSKLSDLETSEFMYLVFKYSEEAGVDPYMIFAKARVETDFDPTVPGAAGELGFIQVMPDTFKLYLDKFGYNVDDFEDWRCTLRVGITHYKVLLDQHKDWKRAEAAYNAGSRGNFTERASYHVRKVVAANNQVSRYREKAEQ
jgi:soluble lytic murein transglycosylase-like protein